MSPSAIWGIIVAWTTGLLLGDGINLSLLWLIFLTATLLLLLQRVPARGKRFALLLLCFLAALPASRRLDVSSPWIGSGHQKRAHEGLRNPHYRPLTTITLIDEWEEEIRPTPARPEWASEPVWGLIQGILLNRRDALDRTWVNAFRSAGAAHLLAVSGLHIAILVMTIMFLFRFLRTSRRVSGVAVALVIWAYVFAIGAPPSAVRAGLMISAWIILKDTLRRIDDGRLFPTAILTALVISPALIASTGFHLSAAAVAGISLFRRKDAVPEGKRVRERFRSIMRVTLGAQAGVLPIQILVFGTVTPLATLVNVVSVPLLSLWLPSTIAALTLGVTGGLPGQVAGAFCESVGRVLLWWIYLWGKIPGVMQPAQPWTSLAAVAGLIAWGRGVRRGRLTALALFSLVVWSPVLTPGSPRIAFLDVGQGDAIVIETRHPSRVIVIDSGPAWENWNAGEGVVAAYLRSRGVRRIDLLVASHSDDDHIGGMTALIEQFEVDCFMRGEWRIQKEGVAQSILARLSANRTRSIIPRSGERIELARNAWFDVIRGLPDASAGWISPGENDRSLVLRLELNGMSVLFPGDLEITGERYLQPYTEQLRSQVLKVAHHGSGDSTSPRFIEMVQPSLAVISVGIRNRHGHPGLRVLDDLESAGARVWRTDLSGALVLRPRH